MKSHGTLYGLVIFISAFLLFQVQPLIGRFILPRFGSSASVWSTTLVFFQLALLAGYAYAHVLATRVAQPVQIKIHAVLLLLAFLSLPIIPSTLWRELDGGDPTFRILSLLVATVGVPYFLLSATSPLLQRWYAKANQGRSPYRLYAVSNAGSLLGLITYPFLIEPLLQMRDQAWLWSAGYAVFALLAIWLAYGLFSAQAPVATRQNTQQSQPQAMPEPAAAPVPVPAALLWLLLSMLPSALLVATSSRMSQDVPAVPFLFVLQLGLYLLTFIIAFDGPRWYWRPLFLLLLVLGIAGVGYGIYTETLTLLQHISVYSLTLFAACMCCHGELARRKPDPQHLTWFYLLIALGGALGGVFSALLAPLIFADYWEFEFSIVGIAAIIAWLVSKDWQRASTAAGVGYEGWVAGVAASVAATVLLAGVAYAHSNVGGTVIAQKRTFYGVLKVWEETGSEVHHRRRDLYHGSTRHGSQFLHPQLMRKTTTYYGPNSGVGRAIRYHPNYGKTGNQFRLGVIGLGVGTLSAYQNSGRKGNTLGARSDDYLVYYEIDRAVVKFAEEYFSYLQQARNRGVELKINVGDARRLMEQQLAAGKPEQLDVLVVDAFSGDSVPTHLLTAEAFAVYLKHLRAGGIVAFHISSRYLRLLPPIEGLAANSSMQLRYILDAGDKNRHSKNRWALVTNNKRFLEHPSVWSASQGGEFRPSVLWTDDFSSLLDVLPRAD